MSGRNNNILRFSTVLVFVFAFISRARAAEDSFEIGSTRFTDDGKEIIVRVNINKFLDKYIDVLDWLIPIVINSPKLEDIKHTLTPNIYVSLEEGYLRNLSNTRRAGNCLLVYRNRVLTLDLTLGYDEVTFDYQYLLKALFYKRTGTLLGNINDLQINVVLALDFKRWEIQLVRLDFVNSGTINIKLEGKLLDYIYNLIIKGVTKICKRLVLNTMQKEYEKMIQLRIDELNFILGNNNEPKLKFVNLAEKNSPLINKRRAYRFNPRY